MYAYNYYIIYPIFKVYLNGSCNIFRTTCIKQHCKAFHNWWLCMMSGLARKHLRVGLVRGQYGRKVAYIRKFKGNEHSKNYNRYFLAPAQRNWIQPILLLYEVPFRSNLQKTLFHSSKLHAVFFFANCKNSKNKIFCSFSNCS